MVLPLIIYSFLTEKNIGEVKFSIAGLIFCVILCPLQCVAEEYFFRGFIMQTIGSWVKFPVVAIIVQSAVFTALHPYNIFGIINIFVFGVIFGVITYITKGLEASCALHIANNMTGFLLTGFGIGTIKKDITFMETVFTCCFALAYLGFVLFATKKLGWYSKIKKDDISNFNKKMEARKSNNQDLLYS